MNKKLAHSMLLMAILAAMMIGGDMVQEGRREMWMDVNPDTSVTFYQNRTTSGSEDSIQEIANIISDEMLIEASDCPQAHREF